MSSHAKGVVIEAVGVTPKGNSGCRKCYRVKLKNDEIVLAYVPHDGGFNFISENDEVLLEKKTMKDIPQVKYRVIKTSGVCLKKLVNPGPPCQCPRCGGPPRV